MPELPTSLALWRSLDMFYPPSNHQNLPSGFVKITIENDHLQWMSHSKRRFPTANHYQNLWPQLSSHSSPQAPLFRKVKRSNPAWKVDPISASKGTRTAEIRHHPATGSSKREAGGKQGGLRSQTLFDQCLIYLQMLQRVTVASCKSLHL